jgi:hypothetical protein
MIRERFFHFIRGWRDSHDIYPYPLSPRRPEQNKLTIMGDIVLHLRVESRLHLSVRFHSPIQSSEPLIGSGLTMVGFPFPSSPNLRICRNGRGSSPVSRRYHMGPILPNSDPTCQRVRWGRPTNSIFLMVKSPDSSLRLGLEEI